MNLEQIQYLVSSFLNRITNGNSSIKDLLVKPENNVSPKILIIKQDEIGDMLYTLHTIEAIYTLYPKCSVTVWCKQMNIPLVQSISNKIKTNTSSNSLIKKYDLVIDLRSNWKSMFIGFYKAKYRLDRGTIRIKNKLEGPQKHEVYTNWEAINILLPDGYKFKYPKINLSDDIIQKAHSKISSIAKPFALFHLGARSLDRRWNLNRFKEIIDYCNTVKGLYPVIIGGESDKKLAEELIKANKNISVLDLTNSTSLLELAALCRSASLFVGNESGPLHFANIESTPLVALFGPGVPTVFYPYHPKSVIIHHLDVKNPMDAIQTKEVKIAIDNLL